MTFWSGETLSKRLPGLIKVFDPTLIDCNAYTLCVGPEAYITPDHKTQNPLRHTAISLKNNGEDRLAIPPGQFGFLLTEEEIEVPETAMAFISMKSTFKLQGLINASGFHVDPGYKGKLIFSVFNAGPKSIHLKRGTPLFLIWYADLDENAKNQKDIYKKTQPGHDTIPLSLINGISGEIQSAHGLSEKIRDLDKAVSTNSVLVKWLFGLLGTLIVALIVALVMTFFPINAKSETQGKQPATSMNSAPSTNATTQDNNKVNSSAEKNDSETAK